MKGFLLLLLAAGPLQAADTPTEGGAPAEERKTITRADLEKRIVALENEKNQFQETIDQKIGDYNTETEDMRTRAQELEQQANSSNPPNQQALQEAQQINTDAEQRQQKRDQEVEPDVSDERRQIQEREQKITKLRSEVDKMAGNDPQNPQLPMPDLKPPGGEDEDSSPSDGSQALPGEDLLMNDQRLDAAGRPTDMSRAEMDAHYGQPKAGSGAGAVAVGRSGGRYLDPRGKLAAAAMPNFTGGRRGSGGISAGRPGGIDRAGAAKVDSGARTGWIPGGRFARSGAGAPISAEGGSGAYDGSNSWSKYGGAKAFRPPGKIAKARSGKGASNLSAGAASASAQAPKSWSEQLLESMSRFKDKYFGGGKAPSGGDASWGNGANSYGDPGMSPGRSLVDSADGYAGGSSGKGLPAYARSGAALDAEGKRWLDYWPYLLAALLAVLGTLLWKLDLH